MHFLGLGFVGPMAMIQRRSGGDAIRAVDAPKATGKITLRGTGGFGG